MKRRRRILHLERLEARRLLATDLATAAMVGAPETDESCHLEMDAYGNQYATAAPVVDPPPDAAIGVTAAGPSPAPLADTFLLHSRPAATKRIYLDFNGHTTSGTAWKGGGTIVTPAYTVDGDPAFSTTELQNIQDVWARVVEDFSPFDVDVTTEEPSLEDLRNTGGSDTRWGIRVVIGRNTGGLGGAGIAYLNSFTWNSDTPCFAFPEYLGNGNPRYVAECVSHEVGHTLGLDHDGNPSDGEYYEGHGSGATGWAPIMGVGYYQEVTQWSKGEYASPTNKEDDLAIITTRNGFDYRVDDYGNTTSTAFVPNTPFGTPVSIPGVIERSTDIDVFSFTTASILTATITPAAIGPNLDIYAEIWDAAGSPLHTSNPVDALNASFSLIVTPGRYFLAIKGTGKGDPLTNGYSNYASLGQYTISLTVQSDFTPPPPPVITGIRDDVAPVTGNVLNGGSSNDTTLTISGTAEAASTVILSDGATVLTSVIADNTGGWTFTTNALSETTHSFTATATDAAGNVSSPSSVYSVTVDRIAPAIPTLAKVVDDVGPTLGTVPSGGRTNDPTPTVSGTAEPNVTVTVFDGATVVNTAVADVTGAWSLITTTLADGLHSLTAVASDAAGNASGPSTPLYLFTVDTTIATPAITSVVDDVLPVTGAVVNGGSSNDPMLSLSGTAKPSSLVTIDDNSSTLGVVTADALGFWSFTTPSLADGPHSFTASATDDVGNQSRSSARFVVALDTSIAPPVITSITDDVLPSTGIIARDGRTNDATPTIAGRAEPGSTVTLFDGVVNLGSVKADIAGAWGITCPTLPEGVHSFTATATDAAANVSTASTPAYVVTIVLAAPPSPTILTATDDVLPLTGIVPDGGATNDSRLLVSGTSAASVTVRILAGNTVLAETTADGGGRWSTTIAPLQDGVFSLTAIAIDDVGNQSVSSVPLVVTIDTTVAPAVIGSVYDGFAPKTGYVDNGGVTNDATPALSGTAEPGGTVRVFDGDTVLGSTIADRAGAWSFTPAQLGTGVHRLRTDVTDLAGNVSGLSSPDFVLTVDVLAPASPTITVIEQNVGLVDEVVVNGRRTRDNTPRLSGRAEAGATVTIFDDATGIGTVVATDAGDWVFTPSALGDGRHAFTAIATDAAGNASDASVPPYVVVVDVIAPPSPTISRVIDDFAPLTGTVGHGGRTNDASPTVSGTAEPYSTVRVMANGSTVGVAEVDGVGAWSLNTSSLPDGTWNFTAIASDDLGNESSPSMPSYTVIIDTVSATPTITAVTDDVAPLVGNAAVGGSINDATPTLTGTAEPLAAVTLLSGDTVVGSAVADDTGLWRLTTSTLPEAAYRFTAVAVDITGNQSAASTPAFLIVIDTIAPVAPSITQVLDDQTPGGLTVSDGGRTQDATPTIVGIAEPQSNVSIFNGKSTLGTVQADANGRWSFTTNQLLDGTYSLTASAADAAGNVGVLSSPAYVFSVDRMAPEAPIISRIGDDAPGSIGVVANGGLTNDATPLLSGMAEPGSTVTVSDGPTVIATVRADDVGVWSLTLSALAEGNHVFVATATDAAGNTSAAARPGYAVTVDTIAPQITAISSQASGAFGPGMSIDITATFSKTVQAGASIDVRLNSGATVILRAPVQGTTATGTYTVITGENAGRLMVTSINEAAVTDLAGNPLASRAIPAANIDSVSIISIDTTPPQIVVFDANVPDGAYGAAAVVPITATLSEPVQAGGVVEAFLSTGGSVLLKAESQGVTLTGTYVVAVGEKASLDIRSIRFTAAPVVDLAGNAMTGPALPDASAQLTPRRQIAIDASIRLLSTNGFSNDASRIYDRRSAVVVVPITFSTPVSGVTLAAIRLLYNGRSVSLKGATLTGSGANYVLRLPSRTTSPRGVYTVQILPNKGIQAVSNGAKTTQPLQILWGNGRGIRVASTVKSKAFANF